MLTLWLKPTASALIENQKFYFFSFPYLGFEAAHGWKEISAGCSCFWYSVLYLGARAGPIPSAEPADAEASEWTAEVLPGPCGADRSSDGCLAGPFSTNGAGSPGQGQTEPAAGLTLSFGVSSLSLRFLARLHLSWFLEPALTSFWNFMSSRPVWFWSRRQLFWLYFLPCFWFYVCVWENVCVYVCMYVLVFSF